MTFKTAHDAVCVKQHVVDFTSKKAKHIYDFIPKILLFIIRLINDLKDQISILTVPFKA